jgi:Holliday junction resolvase RusA-like endonuclease
MGYMLRVRSKAKTYYFNVANVIIDLKIAGKSSTKQRPRFNTQTGRTYTPSSNIISENDVRAVWREAGEPRISDDVAIHAYIKVSVLRPNSHFNTKGNLNKKGLHNPIPRNKKPDLDNSIKTLFDALNSRAYKDDVQIAALVCERVWGKWPETRIILSPMHDPVLL